MRRPFSAYDGEEPYLFVSYSHADSRPVYAELEALRSAGLNIWYDEGISPGSRWTDDLADRLAESDALASRPEGCFHDILFLNAYHRWQIVRGERNGTGEKIAFGRLRHLRSLLQRRFPEVDQFDRHVESTRR